MKKKLKLYRVYLDRPGCGWEEIVKAYNIRAAINKACKKHVYESGGDSVEAVRVPDDYFESIKERRKQDYILECDTIANEYIAGIKRLMEKYKDVL
jgi:hypothetical protein